MTKHTPAQNHRMAIARAEARFKAACAAADKRLKNAQSKCRHDQCGYEPDPCGGRDGYMECVRCGKRVGKGSK
jgi:hypothetical protein